MVSDSFDARQAVDRAADHAHAIRLRGELLAIRRHLDAISPTIWQSPAARTFADSMTDIRRRIVAAEGALDDGIDELGAVR